MGNREEDRSEEELALLHGALGHPLRVAVLRILRDVKRTKVADLRRRLGEVGRPTDTRNLQYHLHRMEVATIVELAMEEGTLVAWLVRDVTLRVRIVGREQKRDKGTPIPLS